MKETKFYTKAAKLVAAIAFFLGVMNLLLGIGVATGVIVEPEPGRYLGSRTSGQIIDWGIYYIIFAIAIGVLSEISESLQER